MNRIARPRSNRRLVKAFLTKEIVHLTYRLRTRRDGLICSLTDDLAVLLINVYTKQRVIDQVRGLSKVVVIEIVQYTWSAGRSL